VSEATDAPGVRKAVNDVLQDYAIEVDGSRALLVGWCVVAEWMAPDGNRWLSFLGTDARGEPAPTWQAQGYLHNALHDWPNSDDAE
jgi:hypothetical protein